MQVSALAASQDLMQDEMGEPQPLPEALNISAEQQSAVLRLYLEKWQKLKEAELQRGKAAEEEAQRLQVRCSCCSFYCCE